MKSSVYNWDALTVEKMETVDRRQILEGSTTYLSSLEIHAVTVEPGKAPHLPKTHDDLEELVIVKEGNLSVTIKNKTRVLGPGSVAFTIPGEEHAFENGGKTIVTYYILRFRSKLPLNLQRGKQAGGSFMIDWKDLVIAKTEKGGRRNFFERPTSMFERFEMHVTTLNGGLKSHEPHKHRAEEIVLLIKGNTEMQIGESQNKAYSGAVIFLGSQVLHALKNIGDEPCEYFAFQWQ